MASQTKRNGKIELFRFVFCVIIIFLHINTRLYKGKLILGNGFHFFHMGYIGVEFFFLLSGYLLAKAALKSDGNNAPLGSQTVSFMKKKILPLVVPHTICFFLCFVTYCVLSGIHGSDIITSFVKSLPNLFFLQKTGISYLSINRVEWYLSRMLFSMLIIYPLCRKFKKTYTNIVAPVIGIIIIGYIMYSHGKLSNVKAFEFFVYRCQLRAFAEINLGVCAFAISERLSEMNFSRFGRAALTVIEASGFLFAVYHTLGYKSSKYDVYALIALFCTIIISFSGLSFGEKIFNNGFFLFLGKLSLPLYLIQEAARDAVIIAFPTITENKAATIISITGFSAVCGVALYFISQPLDRLLRQKLEKLTEPAKT